MLHWRLYRRCCQLKWLVYRILYSYKSVLGDRIESRGIDWRTSGMTCISHCILSGASDGHCSHVGHGDVHRMEHLGLAYSMSFLLVGEDRTIMQVESLGPLHTLHNVEIKCTLKVWMARSAMLRQWFCGGTNWYFILLPLIACLNSSEHSLSRVYASWAWFHTFLVDRLTFDMFFTISPAVLFPLAQPKLHHYPSLLMPLCICSLSLISWACCQFDPCLSFELTRLPDHTLLP